MTHTLTSLLSASNPQILELRILTLHHSDERFSFLKTGGRYRTAWERLKVKRGVGVGVGVGEGEALECCYTAFEGLLEEWD